MTLLLVRHARAGKRTEWEGDDRLRPLDDRGFEQARALVDALAGFELERILSSPYVRCVQTVELLARALGLEIEERAELGEDRQQEGVPAVVAELADVNAALCTHGHLGFLGERPYKKGSVWVLDGEGQPERYLPPPA